MEMEWREGFTGFPLNPTSFNGFHFKIRNHKIMSALSKLKWAIFSLFIRFHEKRRGPEVSTRTAAHNRHFVPRRRNCVMQFMTVRWSLSSSTSPFPMLLQQNLKEAWIGKLLWLVAGRLALSRYYWLISLVHNLILEALNPISIKQSRWLLGGNREGTKKWEIINI